MSFMLPYLVLCAMKGNRCTPFVSFLLSKTNPTDHWLTNINAPQNNRDNIPTTTKAPEIR